MMMMKYDDDDLAGSRHHQQFRSERERMMLKILNAYGLVANTYKHT